MDEMVVQIEQDGPFADIVITADNGDQRYIRLDRKTIRRRIKVKDQMSLQKMLKKRDDGGGVDLDEWFAFVSKATAIPVDEIFEWSLEDVDTVANAVFTVMNGSAVPQTSGATSS